MRRFLSAMSLLLVGCASSPDTSPGVEEAPFNAPEVVPLIERFLEGSVSNIQPGVDRVSVTIEASGHAVFEAVVQVYQDLGIEVAGVDPQAMAVSNPDLLVTRRIAGERVSRYLECGSGVLGGAADRMRIQMSILTQAEARPDGTSRLHTTIQAVGNNPEGTSNTRVPCSSNHQLELRIAAAVEEILGEPGAG